MTIREKMKRTNDLRLRVLGKDPEATLSALASADQLFEMFGLPGMVREAMKYTAIVIQLGFAPVDSLSAMTSKVGEEAAEQMLDDAIAVYEKFLGIG